MLDCMAMYRLRGSSSFGSVDDITVNQNLESYFLLLKEWGNIKNKLEKSEICVKWDTEI
jgi:hypothetical protein